MSNHRDSSEKTSRRKFTKSAITALALTPIVSAATRAQGGRQDDTDRKQEGSPITVGGGGGGDQDGPPGVRSLRVGCTFDHTAYKDQSDPTGANPKKRKFTRPGWKIGKLSLWITGGEVDLSPLLPDDDSPFTITVKCREDADSAERFKFYGNPLGVEFHTGKYPPSSTNPNHNETPDGSLYISKVEIDSPKFKFEKKFMQGDTCFVVVDRIPTKNVRTSKR